METIVITRLHPGNPLLPSIRGHLLELEQWKIQDVPGGGVVVIGPKSRVYIHEEDQRVLLDYSERHFVNQVLKFIADSPEIVVDDDFGNVMPGNLFVLNLN